IIPESENTDNVTGYRKSPEININTADVNMLCEVGVGKTVAAQIVEYRNVYGKFSVKEDIMNVPGVGETLYEKIKDRICVN
ncbi:MAG: helix-hairpin-helix domain-containing protein, partial [Clostridia bacterium]|nr:helix-hairpin-helix domain-containing protein [Clostridia bacterium]